MSFLLQRKWKIAVASKSGSESKRYDVDPRSNLPIVQIPAEYANIFQIGDGIVHHFELIKKVNRKGKFQERILVITNKQLWLCDLDGLVNRYVPLMDLQEVLVDGEASLLGLTVRDEHGVLFHTADVPQVAAVLKVLYPALVCRPMALSVMMDNGTINQVLEFEKSQEYRRSGQHVETIPHMDDIVDWEERQAALASLEAYIRDQLATNNREPLARHNGVDSLLDRIGNIATHELPQALVDSWLDSSRHLEACEEASSKLVDEKSALEHALSEARARIAELEVQLEDARKGLTDQQCKVADLLSKNRDATQALLDATVTVGSLRVDAAQLRAQVDDLQPERLEALEAVIARATAEKDASERRVADTACELQRERDALGQLRKTVVSLTDELVVANARCEELNSSLRAATEALESQRLQSMEARHHAVSNGHRTPPPLQSPSARPMMESIRDDGALRPPSLVSSPISRPPQTNRPDELQRQKEALTNRLKELSRATLSHGRETVGVANDVEIGRQVAQIKQSISMLLAPRGDSSDPAPRVPAGPSSIAGSINGTTPSVSMASSVGPSDAGTHRQHYRPQSVSVQSNPTVAPTNTISERSPSPTAIAPIIDHMLNLFDDALLLLPTPTYGAGESIASPQPSPGQSVCWTDTDMSERAPPFSDLSRQRPAGRPSSASALLMNDTPRPPSCAPTPHHPYSDFAGEKADSPSASSSLPATDCSSAEADSPPRSLYTDADDDARSNASNQPTPSTVPLVAATLPLVREHFPSSAPTLSPSSQHWSSSPLITEHQVVKCRELLHRANALSTAVSVERNARLTAEEELLQARTEISELRRDMESAYKVVALSDELRANADKRATSLQERLHELERQDEHSVTAAPVRSVRIADGPSSSSSSSSSSAFSTPAIVQQQRHPPSSSYVQSSSSSTLASSVLSSASSNHFQEPLRETRLPSQPSQTAVSWSNANGSGGYHSPSRQASSPTIVHRPRRSVPEHDHLNLPREQIRPRTASTLLQSRPGSITPSRTRTASSRTSSPSATTRHGSPLTPRPLSTVHTVSHDRWPSASSSTAYQSGTATHHLSPPRTQVAEGRPLMSTPGRRVLAQTVHDVIATVPRECLPSNFGPTGRDGRYHFGSREIDVQTSEEGEVGVIVGGGFMTLSHFFAKFGSQEASRLRTVDTQYGNDCTKAIVRKGRELYMVVKGASQSPTRRA